ncbi:MAG: endonuclease/exonuclease/phosphatase family protein [Pseudomonadota bacterium]
MTVIECMTWNVHRCRGRDGVIDPVRTADALIETLRAAAVDLVVLTEADAEQPPYGGLLDLGRLEAETGLASAHVDASLRWGDLSHGFLGTVVLHSGRLELLGGHLLDLPGHYPRGATILEFGLDGGAFRLIATHLSLGQPLRAVQMRAIGQYLARKTPMPTLLVGDLNEWRPWGGLAFSRPIAGTHFQGPALGSFPARFPILPLDRVLAIAPAKVAEARVLSSQMLRDTSDHLPLRARVML